MKERKSNWIIAGIVIIGIIIYGIYFFMSLSTTMDKAVLNKIDDTNVTLQIIRIPLKTDSVPSKDVTVIDQNQIRKVFQPMSNLKLKKTSNFDKVDAASEYDVFIYSKKIKSSSSVSHSLMKNMFTFMIKVRKKRFKIIL